MTPRSKVARPGRGLRALWRGSLPVRVLLATLGSSLVVLLLAFLFLMSQATAGIVQTKRDASVTEATSIHAFMQQQLRGPESRNVAIYERLSQLADIAGAQSGRLMVIIQGPTSILASAGIRPESVPNDLRAAVEDGSGMFVTPTEVEFSDGDAPVPGWAVGTVLLDGSGERFPVYYIFPMTSELEILRSLRTAVISTSLVLLLAVCAIALLVTATIMRPVRKASQTALRLASGNLDERMPVRGTDDLASLAVSLNEMAEDLQARIRELERLSAVQRRFVSDVSHELRTPLTTIKMASDVLYEARGSFDAPTGRTAELMSVEIDRFDAMLSDLLEISRFDAGAAVLSLDEVDMAVLVTSEVRNQESLAEPLGISLETNIAAGDRTALIDPRRIRRVLRNLIVNAIEHADGKPVEISLASSETAVAVTVRDHGVGFEASQSTQVFERFWRADPSRARKLGGSGLGLAIALEDSLLHRGWLSAWGRPGKGAQFRLTLPRDPAIDLTASPLPLIPTDISARPT